MIIDKSLQVSSLQALSGTSGIPSSNFIDLGEARRLIGPGDPLYWVIAARVGLDGTTPTLQIAVQTDDDDAFGHRASRGRRRRRAAGGRCELVAHEEPAVAPLHAPARNGVEGRRPQRLPGPQAKAGMVPRAAHRVLDEEALRERAAVMGAGGADGEHLLAAARQ